MDKYITCCIHPFVINQKVAVYKNGECIKRVKVPLSSLQESLYALCKENDIKEIRLSGSQLYGLKLKDEFMANKYANDGIEVSFLNI